MLPLLLGTQEYLRVPILAPCQNGAIDQKEVTGMRQYESMYILKPELESEQTATLVAKYQSLVTEHGGQIDQVQEIGKRRLAYEIDKNREGYYVLMQFSTDTD